ncbi:MAG: helix-turn-helix domain-containing GNAT family N-acetyltransferase [Rhodovibrionaceae bacterium]
MARDPTKLDAQVAAMRDFTRFYSRQAGLLEEGLLKSEFSLTEARVLYELATQQGLTATGIGRDLGLDAGYLSRILKKFERRGLLQRALSRSDARQNVLELTDAGRAAFVPLNEASQAEFSAMLEQLPPEARERLIAAMATVRNLLEIGEETQPPYILRPHRPGDIGLVVSRQATLYHREYGWDGSFEALVAEIGAEFIRTFDPAWENCWIAERNGEVVGSVFVVRQSQEVAKLRMLYVDASARGLGIGARLVGECIAFARAKGYRKLTLWTNDILVSARRIYEAAGFVLVEEEPHHSFGVDLVGQNWDLQL